MRFNLNKLGRVDENAKNIFRVAAPYYLINKNGADSERRKAIFFGCDFKNLPRGSNAEEFIKTTDECLDFVRRECEGCELYYKPHPAETDEFKSLNLDSFEVINDRSIGEFFLYKNLNQIKNTFSVCSLVSASAYGLGLNSHVFTRLFRSSLGDFTIRGYEKHLSALPELAFISDLNQKLEEDRIRFAKNDFLEKQWVELLDKNKGKIWFTVDDPGFLPVMISFARLIKNISPGREVGIIAMRHKRWNLMKTDEIMEIFDDLVFLPAVYYSFRPSEFLKWLKMVFAVRRFKINPGDIIFGVGPTSPHTNCFASYFKNNLRIGLILESSFEFSHNFKIPAGNPYCSIKPAKLFFNKIVEPLFGLYQTAIRLWLPESKNEGLTRFQLPINEVFDLVYVIKPHESHTQLGLAT